MRKGLFLLSLLACLALAFACSGHNHDQDHKQEHDQDDTCKEEPQADQNHVHAPESPGVTAIDPHLDLILDDIKARSLQDTGTAISTSILRQRIAGIKDHSKRDLVKRSLSSDLRACRRSYERCVTNARARYRGRDLEDAEEDCMHTQIACIGAALDYAARAWSNSRAAGQICPICQESLTGGSRTPTLPCGHNTCHSGCIGEWLRYGNTCPICRRRVM